MTQAKTEGRTVASTVAWGSTRPGRHTVTVSSVADLDDVLSRIERDARATGLPHQVDVWAGHWASGEPTPDPFVQALLGHPERGSVIWHQAGDVEIAVDPTVPALTRAITYDRSGQADELDPEWARLTSTQARGMLTQYIANGERPSHGVAWIPPADLS